jgi:DNA primase small subunit
VERREFGFASFEGWMLRHRSFGTADKLATFLCESTPRDAYVSCAYYEFPQEDMSKKGWLGADLVFDIDADHLETPCNKLHDDWVCKTCSFKGKGSLPEMCPTCNGEKFEAHTWPCEICLTTAKNETFKLLIMLMEDFGFTEEDVQIFFSGHRGYHVHVSNDKVKALDAVSRKEIVDYVCGLGLDLFGVGIESQKNMLSSRRISRRGMRWATRIRKSIGDFVLRAEQGDYENLGLRGKVVDTLMRHREEISQSLGKSGSVGLVRGIGDRTWARLIDFAVDLSSAKIDTVVTTDIHRLIRLANTLHGKTGLMKTPCSPADFKKFDPFVEAVAFEKGSVFVNVSSAPKFKFMDSTFGPYENERAELPIGAALLLVCKDRAEVVE